MLNNCPVVPHPSSCSLYLLTSASPASLQWSYLTKPCNVTVVWMAWGTPPSHTPVRCAASTSLTVQPVSRPSYTAARSLKNSELRWSMTASYWLAVRDRDEGWEKSPGWLLSMVIEKVRKQSVSPSGNNNRFKSIHQVRKMTVTWTAMRLLHAPISLKVGCG